MESRPPNRPLTGEGEVKTLTIPLPASGLFDITNVAVLQVPVPLTEHQWGTMLNILEAMKPGLVRDHH